jgi:hypothetical protein
LILPQTVRRHRSTFKLWRSKFRSIYQGTNTLVIAFKNQKGIDRVEVLTFKHGLVIEGRGLFAAS